MKKFILSLCLFLSLSSGIWAENTEMLVVHFRGGNQVCYALNEQPHITYSGENVMFTVASKTVSFLRNAIKMIIFEDSHSSGISSQELGSNNSRPTFIIQDNNLSVEGLAAGDPVRVYSVAGQLCSSTYANQEGRAVVILPTDMTVLIIKTPDATFKLLTK